MIRAAMVPSAAVKIDCTLWLESYFDRFGDQMPNKDEVKLLIMQKTNLFDKYVHDLTSEIMPRATVSRTMFYRLWSALFPKCVSRPWCDVPGKCDTCYEIDRLRRTSEDPAVQDKLKEAHQLHRGGLFMP
jgi:hypothetical protein